MSLLPRQRSATLRRTLALCMGLVFAGFFALGTWQVKRLFWKLDLIERVDQRVHAVPVDAPGPASWPQLNADADAYRHVRIEGRFLYPLTSRVQALTELGSGFWLLTPLCRDDGNIVLVNRGFIASTLVQPNAPVVSQAGVCAKGQGAMPAAASITVTGLLRMSEPKGAFLHHNDPANDRWYSRDVPALALAHQLFHVAPYFIDADVADVATPAVAGASAGAAGTSFDHPLGGMTVISFPNNHLVYALTWYVLALMVALAFGWIARDERKLPRRESA